MQRTTRRWVTSVAVVSAGVLMVGPAVAAFAQTDDPGGSTTTTAPSTTEAAPKALPEWFKSVLDQLVTAGTITQAQADAVTKAVQDARPAMDHRGPWGGGPRGGFGRIGVALDEAAKALGIDLDELRTELQDGKTLAQIATDHHVDIQQVIDALKAAAKAKLDQAVKDGRITQEQADSRLTEMTDRLNDLVNQPFPTKGGPGHRGGHPGDQDGTAPDTSAPTTTAPGGS
jgi:polyhydroxyalkanoate synthesis regulator phasin